MIFASLSLRELHEPFGLSMLADCRIDTLVVEDIDLGADLNHLRGMISGKEITVNRKMKSQVTVNTPSFIFTTSEKKFIGLLEEDPYFLVLEI